MSITYKILEKEFNSNQFHFKQLWREGDYAIYIKTKEGNSGGLIQSYESIKVKRHDGYELGGNYVEPSEMFPSSNTDWGTLGRTTSNLEDAYKAILKIKEWERTKEENKLRPPKPKYVPNGRPRGRKKGFKVIKKDKV